MWLKCYTSSILAREPAYYLVAGLSPVHQPAEAYTMTSTRFIILLATSCACSATSAAALDPLSVTITDAVPMDVVTYLGKEQRNLHVIQSFDSIHEFRLGSGAGSILTTASPNQSLHKYFTGNSTTTKMNDGTNTVDRHAMPGLDATINHQLVAMTDPRRVSPIDVHAGEREYGTRRTTTGDNVFQ